MENYSLNITCVERRAIAVKDFFMGIKCHIILEIEERERDSSQRRGGRHTNGHGTWNGARADRNFIILVLCADRRN